MKISTKGRYGLRIMVDLASNAGDKPRMVSDICKAQGLSPKYAGRLILKLKNAGMISSVRGAGGGYRLKRQPRRISILEIIEAMEGDINIVDCVNCPKKCARSKNCAARSIWCTLNKKIRDDLESVSLQDVLDIDEASFDYCI